MRKWRSIRQDMYTHINSFKVFISKEKVIYEQCQGMTLVKFLHIYEKSFLIITAFALLYDNFPWLIELFSCAK